jgi:hypothetical protein
MRVVKSLWGHLWFKNGDEVDLDGPVPIELFEEEVYNLNQIVSIGRHEIGDDANVLAVFADSEEIVLTSVAQVKKFLKNDDHLFVV